MVLGNVTFYTSATDNYVWFLVEDTVIIITTDGAVSPSRWSPGKVRELFIKITPQEVLEWLERKGLSLKDLYNL